MKSKEQCFVFYERWHTQIQRLPPEEKLQMYEAICNYAFGIETQEMAYYLESLMDNIRIAIDNDKDKQEEFTEKKRRAAHNRWNNAMQSNAEQCNAMQSNAEQCNAMQSNAEQCNAMQRNAEQCNAMQRNAEQCNAMQRNATQCNAMQ